MEDDVHSGARATARHMTTSLRSCRRSKTHHRVVVESQLRRDSQQETAHCIQCSRQSPMHRARWSHSAQEEWISSPDTEEYVRQSSRLVHQMQSRPRVRKMKRRNRVACLQNPLPSQTQHSSSFHFQPQLSPEEEQQQQLHVLSTQRNSYSPKQTSQYSVVQQLLQPP